MNDFKVILGREIATYDLHDNRPDLTALGGFTAELRTMFPADVSIASNCI